MSMFMFTSTPSCKDSVLGFLLSLSLFTCITTLYSTSMVAANWIDPDTPHHAYKTRTLPIPDFNKPKKPEKHSNGLKTKAPKSHQPTATPSHEPTASPTEAPTIPPTISAEHEESPFVYDLVMSDEFNLDGRSFEDGTDPKWTALDKNDYTNDALHYYSPQNVRTSNGDLIIQTKAETNTFVGFNDTSGKREESSKHFQSAMLQTWNKFCFTGGIVEAEIQLPGKPDVGGLWPAFWLLGNMARHTYVGSTNHIWPWSSNVCTEKSKNAQRISGCMKAQHYDLEASVGRGAPEIDIFEVQAGKIKANTGVFLESYVGQPFMSASYQVAPGRMENRPGGGYWPGPGQWYEGLHNGKNTSLNILFYGNYNHFRGDSDEKDYWSDAVSFNHQLDERHFKTKFKYRVEWELPDEEKGTDGYIRWFVNDKFVLDIDGKGIVDAGLGSTISTEPMYIIMNTAVSTQWGFPMKCPTNCPCEKYDCNSNKFADLCGFGPGFCDMMKNKTDVPEYKVNYVRVYQNTKNPLHKVGCSTPERPTSKYIAAHEDMYKTVYDDHPLKPITKGKGKCNIKLIGTNSTAPENCGGSTRGTCSSTTRICVCRKGWTGPHCLAPVGFDPVIYEREDEFEDLGFSRPYVEASGIWRSLGVIGLTLLLATTVKRRLDSWLPVPVPVSAPVPISSSSSNLMVH